MIGRVWALKCNHTFLSNSESSYETAQSHVVFILVAFLNKEGSGKPAQIGKSIFFSHTQSKMKNEISEEDIDRKIRQNGR